MDNMWRRAVGTGHAALWSRADWRAHLTRVRRDCGFEMVRGHGIMDNSVMYYDGADADANGRSENKSSYFDAFSAIDFMLSVDVRPLVELSFTPDPLNKDWVPGLPVPPVCNHFHYDGCETFPTNLTRYTQYIQDFAEALLARCKLESPVAALISQSFFSPRRSARRHPPHLHV
jgi:xylan 1,4-beta-xylosidase